MIKVGTNMLITFQGWTTEAINIDWNNLGLSLNNANFHTISMENDRQVLKFILLNSVLENIRNILL